MLISFQFCRQHHAEHHGDGDDNSVQANGWVSLDGKPLVETPTCLAVQVKYLVALLFKTTSNINFPPFGARLPFSAHNRFTIRYLQKFQN